MSDMGGLRFGSDTEPGIRRRGHQRFSYIDERTGKPPGREHLERIRRLAVPPAWTNVWIAADPDSHVQATGRDARGRKQYRYHPQFTEDRASNKFADLRSFGMALGTLRARVRRDLAADDLGYDQIVAVVVRLLDVTSLRVGNHEYAVANRSFGLTTLRNGHAVVRGSAIRFTFRGKAAHEFDVSVENPRLAKIVRRCQHLPGQPLFEYRTPTGDVRRIGSSDVNAYLSEYAGAGVTAKTFRTWNATVRAASGLAKVAALDPEPRATRINEVIDDVAAMLGNTRTVCRKSYVHPAVIESYLDESLVPRWNRRVGSKPTGITVDERKVLRLLR
jgi:DNA topoisomerase-1